MVVALLIALKKALQTIKDSPHWSKGITNVLLLRFPIAIDYLNSFMKEKEPGQEEKKVPVNKTDEKNKIINILLALQKLDTNEVYFLYQGQVISMLADVCVDTIVIAIHSCITMIRLGYTDWLWQPMYTGISSKD